MTAVISPAPAVSLTERLAWRALAAHDRAIEGAQLRYRTLRRPS
jgi:hypothetical protein